jgi:N-acetyl-gamma-glutamyl-phosphate reductase
MTSIGILGAAGYGGGELLRWLHSHPSARVTTACSGTYAGKPVAAAFPSLAGRVNLSFVPDDLDNLKDCDIVFLARDNGQAMNLAPRLVAEGKRVIDLSADFRFRDTSIYKTWYNTDHASPELASETVYGLPELHGKEIAKARIVGNPGCYTTTSILGLAPLAKQRLIELDSVIVDGKSGVSGAGRTKWGLDYHFAEANESVTAYKVAGTHRHTGEIEQELGVLAGEELRVSFTPHLVPMTRGILATCYGRLVGDTSAYELRSLYREFYEKAPFVYISDSLPSTKHTVGSNMCHIGLEVDPRTRRVTIVSCTDNLGKGMAGQAIQNMNLMLGIDETAGLDTPAFWP